MARTCTVCQHARREEIDVALRHGDSYRDIEKRYSIGRMAIVRHHAHVKNPPVTVDNVTPTEPVLPLSSTQEEQPTPRQKLREGLALICDAWLEIPRDDRPEVILEIQESLQEINDASASDLWPA